MQALLVKYKSVIKFILTFVLVYAVLSFAYKQSESLLDSLGYEASIEAHPDEPSMKLIINNKYVARVIEGCNSISIIILFISFIIAFAGRLKPTIIYLLAGSVLPMET